MRVPQVGDIIRHNGTHACHAFKQNATYTITKVGWVEGDSYFWHVYTNTKPEEWFFYGYFTHISSKQTRTLSEL